MTRTASSHIAKPPVRAPIQHLQVSATVGMIVLLLFLSPPRAAGVADVAPWLQVSRRSTTSYSSS